MMKIRIKSSIAGRFNAHHEGDVVEMPDASAARLIARGIAEAVEEPAGRQVSEEKAIPPASEKAVKRSPRKTRTKPDVG